MVDVKKTHKIIVSSLLAPILSSRDTIGVLEKKIRKTKIKSIDLDFSNVSFVSRSAAHALLLMKERLGTKKIYLLLIPAKM